MEGSGRKKFGEGEKLSMYRGRKKRLGKGKWLFKEVWKRGLCLYQGGEGEE